MQRRKCTHHRPLHRKQTKTHSQPIIRPPRLVVDRSKDIVPRVHLRPRRHGQEDDNDEQGSLALVAVEYSTHSNVDEHKVPRQASEILCRQGVGDPMHDEETTAVSAA